MTEIDFSHLIIFLLFLRAPCQNKYALARKAHLEKVDGRLAKNGWRKVVANGNSLGGLESNFWEEGVFPLNFPLIVLWISKYRSFVLPDEVEDVGHQVKQVEFGQ